MKAEPAAVCVRASDIPRYEPPVLVRYDTQYGVPSFDVLWQEMAYWYEITEDRIDTAPKLVEWIRHLSEKTWVTKEHIQQLIYEVEKRHKGICAYGC